MNKAKFTTMKNLVKGTVKWITTFFLIAGIFSPKQRYFYTSNSLG